MVANSHHFDEEHDPHPDPLKGNRQTQIRIKVKRGNWIRIKLMRIRSPECPALMDLDPDPDPTQDLTSFFINFKNAKKYFFFIFFFL